MPDARDLFTKVLISLMETETKTGRARTIASLTYWSLKSRTKLGLYPIFIAWGSKKINSASIPSTDAIVSPIMPTWWENIAK